MKTNKMPDPSAVRLRLKRIEHRNSKGEIVMTETPMEFTNTVLKDDKQDA